MPVQVTFVWKCLSTRITSKIFSLFMNGFHMTNQIAPLCKRFSTKQTYMQLFIFVDALNMVFQSLMSLETSSTKVTSMDFLIYGFCCFDWTTDSYLLDLINMFLKRIRIDSWFIKCCLRSDFRKNTLSQHKHFITSIFLWVNFICWIKLPLSEQSFPQKSHLKSFLLQWKLSIWFLRVCFDL